MRPSILVRRCQPLLATGMVVLAIVAASPGLVAAQVGQLSGTVTNEDTGAPIPSAQISIVGTTLGVVSGADGSYTIQGIPAGNYTVLYQRIGLSQVNVPDVTITAGQTTVQNVTMRQQPLQIAEIVTTGLVDPVEGNRSPITVGRVSRESMPVPVAGSALQNLQGQIAGVSMARPSGAPGASAQIMLRSATSLGEGTPLIVVDGVILGAGSIDVEAMDIESIEVVKGAAAASLYGSRAADGVIAITTNRGSGLAMGTTQFTARTELGFQSAFSADPPPQHHQFKMTADGTSYADINGNPVGRDGRIVEFANQARQFLDKPYPDPLYDNLNNVFKGGSFQQHTFTIAQNTASTNFAISLNRNVTGGVIPETDGYSRNSFRINLDHRFLDNMSLSVSSYHARSTNNEANVTFSQLYGVAPDVDLRRRDENGFFIQHPDPGESLENPLWLNQVRDEVTTVARTLASATVRWDPASWISVQGSASYDRRDARNSDYFPIGFPTTTALDGEGDGFLNLSSDLSDTWNAEAQVSLRRQLGELGTRVTARGLFERQTTEALSASAASLNVAGVKSLRAVLVENQRHTSSLTEVRANGFLVDAALDWSGKYIGTFLVRRDGSSLFGPDERWQTYYRVAGAWRIGEEDWFNIPHVTEFRLSGARGTAGGRPGFAAQYEVWTLNAGIPTKSQLGNNALKPSLTTENEVSLDVVLQNRYSIDLTYAWQRSEDQIHNAPLLAFTGYTGQWQNGGAIDGRTIEISLQGQMVQRPTFGWTSTFVFDHSRSVIDEWPFGCTVPAWRNRCEGQNVLSIWGFRWVDSYNNLALHDDGGIYAAGRENEFDINEDGLMVWVGEGNTYRSGVGPDGIAGTADDLWGSTTVINGLTYDWGLPFRERREGRDFRPQIGDGTHANVGFINSFSFGAFSIHTQLQGKIGGDGINSQHQTLVNNPPNRAPMMDQAGRPEDLKKPIAYWQRLYNGAQGSTYFVEDGTYMKLRVLSLNYQVPQSRLARLGLGGIGVTSMQLGLIGRDLYTLTNYRGFDPENALDLVGGSQSAGSTYPPARTFTAEVQVTF